MAGCEESEGGEAELSVAPLRFSQGDPLHISLNASASPRAFAKCAEGNATGAYAGEVDELVRTPLGGALFLRGTTAAAFGRALRPPSPPPPPSPPSPPHWSLNVSVVDASADGAARVLVNTTAALSFPISLTLGAITAEIVDDGSAGAAQHSDRGVAGVELGAISVAAGASDARVGGAVELSAARRPALGDLVQRLVDGGSARLCIVGGLVSAGGGGVRVCVANVTRGGGGGGGGSGVLANASVELIATSGGGGGGGAPTTVPCIFPQACAPSSVASLRALPPTNFTLRVALPALPSTLVVPTGVRVSLPPTAVDVGLDQFPAVAAVAVPALTAGGGAALPSSLDVRVVVSDWYGAWRLLHGTGQSAAAQHALSHSMRLRGSRLLRGWSSALPALTRTLPPAPASREPLVVAPTPFHAAPPPPPGQHAPPPQPITLIDSTALSATFLLPFWVRNPAPVAVLLPAATVNVSLVDGVGPKAVFSHIARVELDGPTVLHANGSASLRVTLDLLGEAGAVGGSCTKDACFDDGASADCPPCALAKAMRSLSLLAPTNLSVAVGFRPSTAADAAHGAAAGGEVRLGLRPTVFADTSQLSDAAAAFERRDASFATFVEKEGATVGKARKLLFEHIDTTQTVVDSVKNFIEGGKPEHIQGVLRLRFTNVFSVPMGLGRLRARVLLQDVDGVLPHGAMMVIPGSEESYAPQPRHVIVDHFEKIVGLNLAPGQAGPLETVELPMTWETVLRYEDELYAKHQMCIGARDGVADLTLHATSKKGAAPFSFTHGFNVPQVGSYKRRACHVPATCVPPTASLLKPGALAAADVAVAGSARAAGGGRLQLVDGRNQKGAAYLKRRARFTEGFEANFSFRIEAKPRCTPSIFGSDCPNLDGGFAFVLQASGAAALGDGGGVTVLSVVDGTTNPEEQFFTTFDNATRVNASGYAGLKDSIAIVFSAWPNQFFRGVSSAVSDWSRGSLSLWVGGDVRDSQNAGGPNRGAAQDGGKVKLWDQLPGGGDHRATVRYEPAMRMVYVHLDGALALWAPLTAADVAPLETGDGAWAGFVGAAGPP